MKSKKTTTKLALITAGFFSLVWFLIRVIPKPSRATYPCQRAAFPMASAFVIWLVTIISSSTLLKKSKRLVLQKNFVGATLFSLVALVLFASSFFVQPLHETFANMLVQNDSVIEFVPIEQHTENVVSELLAKVSVVRSSKDNVEDITYSEMESIIREAVAEAGGLEGIVKKGDVVVLKPNLVSIPSTAEFNGRVTDYRVVDIVAKMVKEINTTGKVLVMEGSVRSTVDAYAELKYDEANMPHVDEFVALEDDSGDYQEFNSNKLTKTSLPKSVVGLYPDDRKPNKNQYFYLNKQYFDADVIISIPVLKNHRQAGTTCSVKNVAIGVTPANLYADVGSNLRSTEIDHGRHEGGDVNNLHKWIHDYYICRPVDFTVIDGFQGMDFGPGGNSTKNTRLVIAGSDAVACDAIASLLMQHSPFKVNYLVYLHNSRFGIANPALIDVVGNKTVAEVRTKFNHNQPVALSTMYDKTEINNYQTSYSIDNDTLKITVDNYDTLLNRISVSFDGDAFVRYIVGGFQQEIKLYLGDANIPSGEMTLTISDRYLNSKESTYATGYTRTKSYFHDNLTLRLAPNPVNERLNILLEHQEDRYLNYKIITIGGKSIMNGFMENGGTQVDVTQMEPGIYIVQIYEKQKMLVQKKFSVY
ncbi:MAG: DUF362 domain-containing protein [Bacteroidales bacterium]|nr:DUF362 domain-containing protein [Bacteroidales bacterium]